MGGFNDAPGSQAPKPKNRGEEKITEEEVAKQLDSILHTLNFWRTEGYRQGTRASEIDPGGMRMPTSYERYSDRDKNVADLRKRLLREVAMQEDVLAERPDDKDKIHRESEIYSNRRMLAAMDLVSRKLRTQEQDTSLDDLYEQVKELKPKPTQDSRENRRRPSPEVDKDYHEAKKVNGTDLIIDWVSSDIGSFEGYELYLPQIDSLDSDQRESLREKGIYPNATIGISENVQDAKEIFAYACVIAAGEPDVIKVYEAVQKKVDILSQNINSKAA